MTMTYWALVFLVITLIAALFGFVGLGIAAAGVARVLCLIFFVLFVLTILRIVITKAA